ncbi:helix-turn-helix domain-containing protein [Kribbella sp. NPDC056861]|uniref:helix-turn-helix domain-containing protein n=1 Tax=Kribbella sp. NPDC056861 TaxID=3154857 RepID=UPI003441109C
MSAPPSDVAQLLRDFRTRSGLTQEALAEAAGLSAQAISALENGRRRYPRPVTIDLLVDALDLSVADTEQLASAASRRSEALTSTQLPPPITDFTGRSRQLAELVALLRSQYDVAPGVVISAIGGMGGVGKTTLAVQAAQLVADEFPDGQLYLNLRGGGDEPLSTVDALGRLLHALGVPSSRAADDEDVMAARYRSALAGRRLLLLLDDAVSVAQVRSLMPGTPGTAVVITSRQHLSALAGVRRLDLDVLTEAEALQLLGELLGPDRVAAEPDASGEVVRRCGFLPLAIRIAAEAGRTARTLEGLAAELAEETGRRDLLTGPGSGVGRSILVSLHQLERDGLVGDAEVFPVLAQFDGDHFPLRAAAKVLGRSLDEVEMLLERLVDIHLLETPAPQLYRMHDLVRDVGRLLGRDRFDDAARVEFRTRELACYRAMLWRLDETARRFDIFGADEGEPWSAGAEDVLDQAELIGWLRDELPNLVRLVRTAAAGVESERLTAVRMALGMHRLAGILMRFGEAHQAITAIVRTQVDLDPRLEVGRLYYMGFMDQTLGLYEASVPWSRAAVTLARNLPDPLLLVACLIDLAYGLGRIGQPADGLPFAEEAVVLVERHQLHSQEINANIVVGAVAGWLGDLERQRAAFDRALTLMPSRTTVGPSTLHRSLMGRALQETGQYQAALEVLTNALTDAREAKLEVVESDLLRELGSTWLALGEPTKAEEVLTASLEIALRFPADHREPAIRHHLGQALAGLSRPEDARLQWEQALTQYRQAADPRAEEVVALLAGSDDCPRS